MNLRIRRSSYSLPAALLCGLLALSGPASGQINEHFKLLPSDGAADDTFGISTAIDGGRVAVGAYRADDAGINSGSAYLFAASTGVQLLELHPTGAQAGDGFGFSVAMDGDLVAVGAPFAAAGGVNAGAAYLFDAATGVQLATYLPVDGAAGDEFGYAVALENGIVIVGAKRDDDQGQDSGSVYLFDALSGVPITKLMASDGSANYNFGEAIDVDGGILVVGAHWANGLSLFSGAAYLFDVTTGVELHKIQAVDGGAFDFFGASVAIDDGVVVVGARNDDPHGKESGSAYLFDASTGAQTVKLDASSGSIFEQFGAAVAIDKGLVAVTADQDNDEGFSAGSVYLFDVSGSELARLFASDAAPLDELGSAVAVTNGVVVVGATGSDALGSSSGAAYVFDNAGAVTPMSSCLGNVGTLAHTAGIAVGGHTLGFEMDAGQPGGATALLFAAAAPVLGWPACGIDLGAPGELLIDVAPTSLFAWFSTSWSGAPAALSVPIPAIPGIVGLQAYLQGVFVAPGFAAEPLRLTNGLALTIGGFY